jgi:5-formyltetrahydrofolate cyclo-ligase
MSIVYHGILKIIMPAEKKELRAQLKQVRAALSASEQQARSSVIVNRLKQLINWSSITTLHCFEPITRLNEVDVSGLVITLQAKQPSLQVYTSRRIDSTWRIVSWHGDLPVTELRFDVIIVPVLGFDAGLHRIGYGGGYYDRFLATQPTAKKIGVCFEIGQINHIPAEPHDIPLDMIITEKNTYQS